MFKLRCKEVKLMVNTTRVNLGHSILMAGMQRLRTRKIPTFSGVSRNHMKTSHLQAFVRTRGDLC